MFAQFIEGQASDPRALRDRLDRWSEDLASTADGWLGTTAGVTADGTAFIMAHFESADAARVNSARPEQSAWWEQTSPLLGQDVAFLDSEELELFRSGGSDSAGFVQVIRGQVTDVTAARDLLLEEMPDDARPDVLGGLLSLGPDGEYAMVVYFTSEEQARTGEASEADESFVRRFLELHEDPPRYLDVTEPWMWSP
jgi:hypothetical protein